MKLLRIEHEGKTFIFNINAYVNLTEMCAAFGRSPHHFLQLSSTLQYITALAADTGMACGGEDSIVIAGFPRSLNGPEVMRDFPASLLVTIKGQHSDGRAQGTWAHPELALECAAWLSPTLKIWMNRTIRAILNGELIHPAMDKEDLKEREARIEGLKNKTAVEKDRFWQAQVVEGSVCLQAYFLAFGIDHTVPQRGMASLGNTLRHLCRRTGHPIGRIRIRKRPEKKTGNNLIGWRTAATFPPRLIHAELIKRGWLAPGTPVAEPALVARHLALITAGVWGAFRASLPQDDPGQLPGGQTTAVFQRSTGPTVTASSPDPRQPELAL